MALLQKNKIEKRKCHLLLVHTSQKKSCKKYKQFVRRTFYSMLCKR